MLHIRYDMFLIALRLLKRAMIALDLINLGTDLTVKIAIGYWYNLVSESSSVGRASAFQAEGRRFETGLSLQIYAFQLSFLEAGWSSQVARRAHNPKVEGSNPSPATNIN